MPPPCIVYAFAYTIIRVNTCDERKRLREAYGERRYQSVGVFNSVALFVVWTPRGKEGDIPHFISVRKAENHEQKNWARYYRKRR